VRDRVRERERKRERRERERERERASDRASKRDRLINQKCAVDRTCKFLRSYICVQMQSVKMQTHYVCTEIIRVFARDIHTHSLAHELERKKE